MQIWSAEIKELESLYTSIKGRFPELEKELEQLIKFDDANVILLYSRRCLEVIINDLCINELKRPRKTDPLKSIIDKLNHDEKVPEYIITSMHSLNDLATYGAHPKDFDPAQIKPALLNLDIIIKWYLKHKEFIGEIRGKKKPGIFKKTLRLSRNWLISGILLLSILIIAGIFAYPKIFTVNSLEKLQSSGEKIVVAVMPFQNMTNDSTLNIWQDGIQNELITSLTSSEELKIRQVESVNSLIQRKGLINYASITPSFASSISRKLEANVYVVGSLKKAGNTIRVNAQLNDSKTKETFKSFQIDGSSENILKISDSLSGLVRNSLIISKLKQQLPVYDQSRPLTGSSEAYRYYLYGENARKNRDFPTALNMYMQALAIDSNYTLAILKISVAYMNQGLYEESREWGLKAYKRRDQVPLRLKILINKNHAFFYETPNEEVKCLRQLLEIDDIFPGTYYDIGLAYMGAYQYDKAIPEFEKSLEIYKKFGCKPWWVYNYSLLGESYHKTGQYKKEKKLYRQADKDFPNNPLIIYLKAILSLTEEDTTAANNYLNQYISLSTEDASSEEFVSIGPAEFYIEAANLEKAEEYLRKELSAQPDNVYRIYKLAMFLIDKESNVDEGLQLIEKALASRPDLKWYLLDCKGWGLYKKGKYNEALKILQECWDSRVYYEHPIYLHLEAARKAVTGL
jgi:tetratricopeptide (TPR) repeat protein